MKQVGCELQNIDEKYYVKSDLKCLTMIIYRKCNIFQLIRNNN
jgi:hypothetical protein